MRPEIKKLIEQKYEKNLLEDYATDRRQVLYELGLVSKIETDNPEEADYSEYIYGEHRYFKYVETEVSDEEYEELLSLYKTLKLKETVNETSGLGALNFFVFVYWVLAIGTVIVVASINAMSILWPVVVSGFVTAGVLTVIAVAISGAHKKSDAALQNIIAMIVDSKMLKYCQAAQNEKENIEE